MCGGGGEGPSQTPEEKALGKIAVEKWNDHQIRFRPIENEFIKEVQKTPDDFNNARGNAASSVQQAFSEAKGGLVDNLNDTGVDLGSSQAITAMDGLETDRGLSLGTGINEAEMSVDNAHLAGLQSVVQMGQGQSMDAVEGMSEMAGNATEDAIQRSQRSFTNRQAGLSLVGNVAGAGASAYLNQTPQNGTDTVHGSFDRVKYNQETGKGGY